MSTLKVGTIQDHANSTTAMTIDSAGRVLQPTKPVFNAFRPTGADIASGNTYVFNDTSVNIGGGFNTSTGKFTAPIAGTYFFSTTCLTSSNAAANDLQIRVDGTNIAQARIDVGSAGHNSISITVIATLTANQVVDVYVAGGGGMYSGGGRFSTFCGYLIG